MKKFLAALLCVFNTSIAQNNIETLDLSISSNNITVGNTLTIDWNPSIYQDHIGIYLWEDTEEIAIIHLTNSFNDTGSTIYNWQVPATITDYSNNSITHTLDGSNYKIKVVVWDGWNEESVNNIEHSKSDYITINPISNSPPNFINGFVSPSVASPGAILLLNATWNDLEGDQIDAVEFRYKKNGGSWNVISGFDIDYILGSTPPSYTSNITVNTPGYYQFESRAKDSYGNWSEYTSSGSFNIETPPNEAPSIANFISAPNTINTSSTNIVLQKGYDPENDPTQLICWSSNTNYTQFSPYQSSLNSNNNTIEITFTFSQEGSHTIYAKTLDNNGNESPTTSHTLYYTEEEDIIPIEPPSFGYDYTEIDLETNLSILYGQSNLTTKCIVWATNSNYTSSNPFESPLFLGETNVDVDLIFSSAGLQTIYAKTIDNQNQESSISSINVNVLDIVTPLESISLGDFLFTADNITELSDGYYSLSGNVLANDVLNFSSEITIDTNNNIIDGSGSIYLNNIANEGLVEVYNGNFQFYANEANNKLIDQGFSIVNSSFAILEMPIYISSIALLNDGINLSGELEFPEVFNYLKTTVNEIQITQSNGIQIAGSFQVEEVHMDGFTLNDLIFEYNTIENSFAASGEIETNLFEASVNVGFVDGGLNDIGMYIEVSNPKPLGTTGLALAGAGGSISNIQNPPISLAFTTTLVPALPGPPIVEFNDITISYTFGTSLEGSGKFTVLGQECANASFKIEQGNMICEGNINFIDILNADVKAAIIKNENDAIDLYGQFQAEATIPGIFNEEPYKWINGLFGLPHPIASTNNILFNTTLTGKGTIYNDDDENLEMSYELIYEDGEIQYDFAKNYSLFNDAVFPPVNSIGVPLEFQTPPINQAKSPITRTYNRFENRSLIIKSARYLAPPTPNAFSATSNTIQQDFVLATNTTTIVVRVENTSFLPNYGITLPNGEEVNTSNTGDFDNILKSEFENTSYYTIKNAEAGIYYINIENESEEYLVDIYGTKDQMGIILNDISPLGDFINIEWVDIADDTNATISLFYDTDSLGLNGTLITAGIEEDDNQNSYLWNTSNLDPGNYYIYAVMHGENYEPAYHYTNNTFTKLSDINGPENLTILSFNENLGQVDLSWDSIGENYNYLVYSSQSGVINLSSPNYNTGTNTTFSFDDLETSESYQFMVTAINSEGHISNPSEIVTVEFQSEENYFLNEGWNFIGLKNNPDDTNVTGIFNSIMEHVIQIKSETSNYNPAIPDFLNTLNDIEIGKAYWVNVDQEVVLTTIGAKINTELNPINLNLNEGWNYISYPKATPTNIATAIANIEDKVIQIKGTNSSYNPALPEFLNTLQQFEFGKGYFINVTEDCNLTIQ